MPVKSTFIKFIKRTPKIVFEEFVSACAKLLNLKNVTATINGTVKMQLNKVIKAKGVIVILYSETTQRRMTKDGLKDETMGSFEFPLSFDGEKEYGMSPVECPLR